MTYGREYGKRYYDAYFSRRKFPRVGRVVRRRITTYIPVHSRVLDLGCGDGTLAKLCVKAGHQYTGVDISSVAIERAREFFPQAKFFVKDLREYAQRDIIRAGNYDVVTAVEFLEHINDDLDVISDIPSGKCLLFSVPNFWHHAHVRCFLGVHDVMERYSPLVSIKTVLTIARRKREGSRKRFLVVAET